MAKKKNETVKKEKVTPEPKKETPVPKKESSEQKEITQLKSQLIQALEVNDRLIGELESKEKELSVFQEIKFGLENVIEDQNSELTTFKEQIQALHIEKFQERVSGLAKKWIKKYGLSEDKAQDVTNMLSKFQSEEELNKMESLMGLVGGKEVSVPRAITKPTAQLTETFANRETMYADLSPEDKREYLWSQMEALKNRLPK